MTATDDTTMFSIGSLVRARGREWAVQPGSDSQFLILRPLGGADQDHTGVFPSLEPVESASFASPTPDDLGDHASARMLRDALRIGFRSSAGPFRSLASIAVEPRSYQLVPLLMALRQDTVRLLIADDVGIGKTIESGLIAAELLASGEAKRLSVLCSPALAEQWQSELRNKFGLNAELVLSSTARRLQKGLEMGESVFDRYPVTVVSTDFIKSQTRMDEFIRSAPELLIVDEAHTAVSDGSSNRNTSRTQRHELLQGLAANPSRHLILVTATPHSGQEQGFNNLLELLDPALPNLNLDRPEGRAELAKYFVQRRRGDIRKYLANTALEQETPFPRDRETQELPYTLTPEYQKLFAQVLDYARERVQAEDAGTTKQRVAWWSVLALLRALASSPVAASATLRKRAANVSALTIEEADELGRATVLDAADDESREDVDSTPGAITDAGEEGTDAELQSPDRRRLLTFARSADELANPDSDAKLAAVIKTVKSLLEDGFAPIVFCRFIDTADYVGKHLATSLGRNTTVAVVTGELPPEERLARIDELTQVEGQHVLVATDCLAEGVNLQEDFQAVVHYDLAWNPTRHEQREGRVDRFGQKADIVRAVTIYGKDNQIDGVVLDVLLRKHAAIRKATGVSVPVPASSNSVVEALMEGLMLRGSDTEQLSLDIGVEQKIEELDQAWNSAAEAERTSHTKYAQAGIKPEEVAAEVTEIRDALGTNADIAAFVDASVRALGGIVNNLGTTPSEGLRIDTGNLPAPLQQAFTPGHNTPLTFYPDPPAPRKDAVLNRTDPDVAAIASFVLEAALDSQAVATSVHTFLARRTGVFRSEAVNTRTTVIVLRERVSVTLPGRDSTRTTVVEHAETLAFTGQPTDPTWLSPNTARDIVEHPASSIGGDRLAVDAVSKAIDGLPTLSPHLNAFAEQTADRVEQSHRRVRSASGDRLRGLKAEAILPPDVLGIYVYLPVVTL